MRNNYYAENIELPNGRKVRAYMSGYDECDTNAFIQTGDITAVYEDTHEELTEDELNEEILVEGRACYLHEYIDEVAEWKLDEPDEPDFY